MVGTRRRSTIVAEDVKIAVTGKSTPVKAAVTGKSTPVKAAVTGKSTPAKKAATPSALVKKTGTGTPADTPGTSRRSRRVSEITMAAAEDLTPRATRTKTATPEVAVNPVLEKVKGALTQVRSPRTSNSSANSPATVTPTRGRGRAKVSTPADKTTTMLSEKKVNLVSESAETTPRSRARKVVDADVLPGTPALGGELEKRSGTRTKLVSESLQDGRPATPTRKSRRLSGSIPEMEDSPAVLPLKKRRSSLSLEPVALNQPSKEENLLMPVLPEIKEAVEVSPIKSPKKVAGITAVDSDKVSVLDIIEEEESNPDPPTQKPEEKMVVENAINTGKKINKNKDEMKIFEDLQRLILINHIPRQKPKSGKFWKQSRSQFRQIKKDRGQRRTFEDRLRLKEDRQRNQDLANQIKQNKLEKRTEIVRRIEENKKAKEERQLKNEVYQVVKNPNKIKRMKKRDLAKRDILGKI